MTKLSTIQIEKRKTVSGAVKQKVLTRCSNMCVCCGQTLTPKTATIEHVVPLSRGGENDIKNYVTLCKTCNTIKNNDIYPPHVIYRQLYTDKANVSPKMVELRREISQYFLNWFDQIYRDFPVKTNPLIAPTSVILYQASANHHFDTQRHKKKLFIDHKYRVDLITKDDKDLMEKQTGLFYQNIINDTHQLAYANRKRKDPVAIYTINSIGTKNRIKMVFSIVTDTEHNRLILYCPYSTFDKTTATFVADSLLDNLTTILNECLHVRIDQIFCFAPQRLEHVFTDLMFVIPEKWYLNTLTCTPIDVCDGIAPGIKTKRGDPVPLTLTMLRLRFNDKNQSKTNRKSDFYDDYRLTQEQFKEIYKDRLSKKEINRGIEISNAHKNTFNKSKKRADKLYNQQKQSKINKNKPPKKLTNKQKKKQNMAKQK